MNFACDAKIIPLSTMDVIAENVAQYAPSDKKATVGLQKPEIESIATILDAKRGQFYIAVYKRLSKNTNTQYEKIQPDCLMTASQFLDRFAQNAEPIWLLGEGLVYHKDAFKAENIHFFEKKYWTPRAAKVHSLGWQLALEGKFADPLTLQPNYLLRPDAEVRLKSRP